MTESMLKVVATAPALERLSLTLGSSVKTGLHHLSGHNSIRELSIFFEGFTPPGLPTSLPKLEVLRIRVGAWTYWNWTYIIQFDWWRLEYPMLRRLEIHDQAGNSVATSTPLHMEDIKLLRARFPATRLVITQVGSRSNLRHTDIQLPLSNYPLAEEFPAWLIPE